MFGPPGEALQTIQMLFQHFDHNISKSLVIACWKKKVGSNFRIAYSVVKLSSCWKVWNKKPFLK